MKLGSIKNWKRLGKLDPYYGVLSEEKFKTKNISEETLLEFFSSGESFVKETESRINKFFDRSLAECSIFDFGCGVGRLVIPFARLTTKEVFGADVSPDIIDKAIAHKKALNLQNLELLTYNGMVLPRLPQFDFINSYIVFQHIETPLGFSLLQQLFDTLKIGGMIQVQITYGHKLPTLAYWNFFFRGKFSVYNYIYSLLKNRTMDTEPIMQMNHYSPRKLFDLFSRYTTSVQVEFTDHGGHLGAYYLMRRDF